MAIAFDANSGSLPANGTSYTLSHTCTGSNLNLIVWVFLGNSTDVVSGVTYNGVSMTRVAFLSSLTGFTGTHYCYILAGPATGAHNIVVSGSTTMTGGVLYGASYTGCSQTSIPDSFNTKKTASSTSFSISTTVVASNCWLAAMTQDDAGNSTAGAGTIKRSTLGAGFGQQCWDSNGTVGTGSRSLAMSNAGSSNWNGIIISISPPVASTNTNFLLMF